MKAKGIPGTYEIAGNSSDHETEEAIAFIKTYQVFA